MRTTQLSEEVLAVLSTANIDGNCVKLTCGQLDRKLYQDVNKALEAIGGKWNRKAQGHIFASDPEAALDNAILTGEVTPPSKNGYFPTPKAIAIRLVELAGIIPGMCVLEPSAGQGGLADFVPSGCTVDCVEILPDNVDVLRGKGHNVQQADFLQIEPTPIYDIVIMNPPFS
jgi:hypothetical protein